MKQVEIWYADLNPVKGSEQQEIRSVVIISDDLMNTYLPVGIACPLTLKTKNHKGNIVLGTSAIIGITQRWEVMTFHNRSISKERLVSKIGMISREQLIDLKQGLDDTMRY